MPRPTKRRRICGLPEGKIFVCADACKKQAEPVVMTLEEYETVRLIDHVGLNQEECAEQMAVARTTAQRIYNSARSKLAEHLITGATLKIEGGNYDICTDRECGCRMRQCGKRQCGCHQEKGRCPKKPKKRNEV